MKDYTRLEVSLAYEELTDDLERWEKSARNESSQIYNRELADRLKSLREYCEAERAVRTQEPED